MALIFSCGGLKSYIIVNTSCNDLHRVTKYFQTIHKFVELLHDLEFVMSVYGSQQFRIRKVLIAAIKIRKPKFNFALKQSCSCRNSIQKNCFMCFCFFYIFCRFNTIKKDKSFRRFNSKCG